MNKGKVKIGQIAIGVLGIAAGGLLSYLTEKNAGMRLLFLRVLIGVSIGLLMSGFLENQIKVLIKFKGVIITALGADTSLSYIFSIRHQFHSLMGQSLFLYQDSSQIDENRSGFIHRKKSYPFIPLTR